MTPCQYCGQMFRRKKRQKWFCSVACRRQSYRSVWVPGVMVPEQQIIDAFLRGKDEDEIASDTGIPAHAIMVRLRNRQVSTTDKKHLRAMRALLDDDGYERYLSAYIAKRTDRAA